MIYCNVKHIKARTLWLRHLIFSMQVVKQKQNSLLFKNDKDIMLFNDEYESLQREVREHFMLDSSTPFQMHFDGILIDRWQRNDDLCAG